MKTVILAGGRGTRLSEESGTKPKPMVEVGGRPILWHIMRIYASQGFNEFLVALGYKGEVIKDYFLNYHNLRNSLTIDLATNRVETHGDACEDWRVHLKDTGMETLTAGRILRLRSVLGQETFMMTYGDGVADVDLRGLVEFHHRHGKLATVTAVRPPARFGELVFEGDGVTHFDEKPQTGEGWINGGFFVLEPGVFEYLGGDDTSFERSPLANLAADGELVAYRHSGFWQCMDTLRDVHLLNRLWRENSPAPWERS